MTPVGSAFAEDRIRCALGGTCNTVFTAKVVALDVQYLCRDVLAWRERLRAQAASPSRDTALAALDAVPLAVVNLQAWDMGRGPEPEVFHAVARALLASTGQLLSAIDAARAAGETTWPR